MLGANSLSISLKSDSTLYIEIESNSFTVEIFSEYYGLDEEEDKDKIEQIKAKFREHHH